MCRVLLTSSSSSMILQVIQSKKNETKLSICQRRKETKKMYKLFFFQFLSCLFIYFVCICVGFTHHITPHHTNTSSLYHHKYSMINTIRFWFWFWLIDRLYIRMSSVKQTKTNQIKNRRFRGHINQNQEKTKINKFCWFVLTWKK